MLSTLKTYGIAIAGGLVFVLLAVLRVVTKQNSKLRVKAETAQARVDHAKTVLKEDKAADEQADVRLVDAKNEIKNTGGSSTFRDPNRLFDRSDNK